MMEETKRQMMGIFSRHGMRVGEDRFLSVKETRRLASDVKERFAGQPYFTAYHDPKDTESHLQRLAFQYDMTQDRPMILFHQADGHLGAMKLNLSNFWNSAPEWLAVIGFFQVSFPLVLVQEDLSAGIWIQRHLPHGGYQKLMAWGFNRVIRDISAIEESEILEIEECLVDGVFDHWRLKSERYVMRIYTTIVHSDGELKRTELRADNAEQLVLHRKVVLVDVWECMAIVLHDAGSLLISAHREDWTGPDAVVVDFGEDGLIVMNEDEWQWT